MELSVGQKQKLYRDGFVLLPGAVPPELVDAALRAINASLGDEGIDPAQLATFRAQSYCPELQGAGVIKDLVQASDVWTLAESAIGAGQIGPLGNGQIALRFPSAASAASQASARAPHPHLDGMYTPTNGVPKGTIRNFTALVGVVLSDVPHADMGNLIVWPGSHLSYEQYFRDRGPQALLEGMPLAEPRLYRLARRRLLGHGTRWEPPYLRTPSTSVSSTSTTPSTGSARPTIWREWGQVPCHGRGRPLMSHTRHLPPPQHVAATPSTLLRLPQPGSSA